MIEDEAKTVLEQARRLKNSAQQLIAESEEKLTVAEKLIQLSRATISHTAAQLKELRQAMNKN